DFATYALAVRRPAEVGLGLKAAWLGDLLLYLGIASLVPLLELLFPTGHLPRRNPTSAPDKIWWILLLAIVLDEVLLGLGIGFERHLLSFPAMPGPFAGGVLSSLASKLRVAGLAL